MPTVSSFDDLFKSFYSDYKKKEKLAIWGKGKRKIKL